MAYPYQYHISLLRHYHSPQPPSRIPSSPPTQENTSSNPPLTHPTSETLVGHNDPSTLQIPPSTLPSILTLKSPPHNPTFDKNNPSPPSTSSLKLPPSSFLPHGTTILDHHSQMFNFPPNPFLDHPTSSYSPHNSTNHPPKSLTSSHIHTTNPTPFYPFSLSKTISMPQEESPCVPFRINQSLHVMSHCTLWSMVHLKGGC
ncbi:hypothetical protein VNO78_21360 [Psophocarpus tetragonolobus]|uniref:Uncharacterized protein n=1 Tax=Psophocarpus tetragonolobus TaxID=3891 RepID=A0AAN9SBY8_PSOTE